MGTGGKLTETSEYGWESDEKPVETGGMKYFHVT